ncbi:importin beta- [Stylonychia lemnae]|uniref:Importin beta n=1 Tax=Stylonychia lemnae TaxID=5949 RepID=A0A078ASA9_STYLE|nr:importin beta- [Stylonychia lemnae]|eukprot:CDW84107.1 importin beta- [Stylonychia lemnae]
MEVALQVVQGLKEADNNIRKQAEEKLNQLREHDSQNLLKGFIDLICIVNNEQVPNQVMAAVLLKKLYLDKRTEEASFWQLSGQDFVQLKDQILTNIDFQQPMLLLKKKADIICACYREIKNYPELIQQLVAVLQSQDQDNSSVKKEYAMHIFEVLAEYHLPQEEIVQNSNQFMQLFLDCLKDSSISVKVAALKAITSFLGSIDDESAVLKYQDLMDGILDVVIEVLRSDEDKGKASLESMIELTQSHGEIWTKVAEKLLFVISQIIQNKSFDDSIRQSALEIISTLAEDIPTLLRKHQNELKTHFFPALAHMLAELPLQDDLEEWNKEVEEELQARNDPSSVAADNLNRIASFLGEKTLINCTSHIIKEAIEQKGSWQLRSAGYIFLGMISDTCSEAFRKGMDEIMKMCAAGLIDEHPRVRYEALTCLGLLLTELAPDAQKKFHSDLIVILVKLMQDEQLIKLRKQATSAMVNFVRGLINEEDDVEDKSHLVNAQVLEPYADDLVNTISMLFEQSLQSNYPPLQEEVLGLLSCLANVLETKFAQYYGRFMPGLKQILATVPWETQQQQELRAHCIQTIGFILNSVKDQTDICRSDALEVSTLLTTLLNSDKIKDSDPQSLAIQNTLSQIGACLKSEFKQFLPQIMPALLRDAGRDIDLKIQDAELPDAQKGLSENVTSLNIKIKGFEGERQITMNTNALENKINAIQIIKNIASNLGTGFFEQVEPVAQLISSQLINYTYSRAVRKIAIQTIVFLLNSCQDSNHMKALWQHIYPGFKDFILLKLSKFDFSELRFLMRELQKCMKQFWNFGKQNETFLSLEQVAELIKLLNEVFKAVKDDKQTRLEQFKTAKKKMDEEDVEFFHEDLKKVDKIQNYVMEISGVLIHVYKGSISQLVIENLLNHFAVTLQNLKGSADYEILNSVCFFCDILEYGGDDLFNLAAGKAAEKFIEVIRAFPENRDLIQSAGYGLGVVGMRTPQGQFGLLSETFQTLKAIIDEADSRSDEEKVDSTDNCISAYGKLVLFQFDNNLIGLAQLQEFLNLLPLYSDSDEAQSIHNLFFDQILKSNPVLSIAEVVDQVKLTVQRIINIAQSKPDLELLDDDGKAKAEKIKMSQKDKEKDTIKASDKKPSPSLVNRCKKHPKALVSFQCQDDNEEFCDQCFSNHSGHKMINYKSECLTIQQKWTIMRTTATHYHNKFQKDKDKIPQDQLEKFTDRYQKLAKKQEKILALSKQNDYQAMKEFENQDKTYNDKVVEFGKSLYAQYLSVKKPKKGKSDRKRESKEKDKLSQRSVVIIEDSDEFKGIKTQLEQLQELVKGQQEQKDAQTLKLVEKQSKLREKVKTQSSVIKDLIQQISDQGDRLSTLTKQINKQVKRQRFSHDSDKLANGNDDESLSKRIMKNYESKQKKKRSKIESLSSGSDLSYSNVPAKKKRLSSSKSEEELSEGEVKRREDLSDSDKLVVVDSE